MGLPRSGSERMIWPRQRHTLGISGGGGTGEPNKRIDQFKCAVGRRSGAVKEWFGGRPALAAETVRLDHFLVGRAAELGRVPHDPGRTA